MYRRGTIYKESLKKFNNKKTNIYLIRPTLDNKWPGSKTIARAKQPMEVFLAPQCFPPAAVYHRRVEDE
jgi:hypothetical protein